MEFNTATGTVILSVTESQKIIFNMQAIDAARKNKLSFSATLFNERVESQMKKYNEKIRELTTEFAAKDDNGDFKMVTNKDGVQNQMIDPLRVLEYNVKRQELGENTLLEIEIYKCHDKKLIDELPFPVIYALNGILFDYDFSEFETDQNSVQQREINPADALSNN